MQCFMQWIDKKIKSTKDNNKNSINLVSEQYIFFNVLHIIWAIYALSIYIFVINKIKFSYSTQKYKFNVFDKSFFLMTEIDYWNLKTYFPYVTKLHTRTNICLVS